MLGIGFDLDPNHNHNDNHHHHHHSHSNPERARFSFEVYDDTGQFYSHHQTQEAASNRILHLIKMSKQHPNQDLKFYKIRCKYSGKEYPIIDMDGDHVMQDNFKQ